MYYCSQANGFTPARLRIENQTGIAFNKISEIRQGLVKRGLIQYDAQEGFIFIDWNRLRIFAMLDKP